MENAVANANVNGYRSGGFVYFIQGEGGGPIKIGWAVYPRGRLSSLQASSPVRLRLLAYVPGGVAKERRLHQQFAADRLHGEWFIESDKLHAEIDRRCGRYMQRQREMAAEFARNPRSLRPWRSIGYYR